MPPSPWLRDSFRSWGLFSMSVRGRALAVTMASVSVLVKLFKIVYLLNLKMEVLYTCPDVRYWSEVLCCTIWAHMSDLEVKVLDFKKNYIKVFQ